MNKSKAKRMSITEMKETLPKWFSDNFYITFRLLTTNSFVDLARIKTFLSSSLTHLTLGKKDKIKIKYVSVDIEDKGIRSGYQYITTSVYVITTFNTTSETRRITKSCKVKLRVSLQKWD